MRSLPTAIADCLLVQHDIHRDERGSLWKPFSANELARLGLDSRCAEVLVVKNDGVGTLRGLHYQQHPMGQAKVVSVLRGSILDVVVDLRKEKPSYRQVVSVVLNADTGRSLYVPAGCAHGYLTLDDDTDVVYTLSQCHSQANERGIRWDDPVIGVLAWPGPPLVVSQRDLEWPPWKEE